MIESKDGRSACGGFKKQLNAVKKLLGEERDLKLSDEEALRYQDVLILLEDRGDIHDFNVDGMNWYRVMADLSGFEDWLNEEIKDAKQVTRREWTIGIVCAVIGLIPYIATLFQAS